MKKIEELGPAIARWRWEHGKSQTETARLLGCARNSLTLWEGGKALPSIVFQKKIEDLLKSKPQ